jgi:hypothetical protein
MAAELVRSDRLYSGVPYAYAATAPETGLIVSAGACPLDDQGRVVAPGDIAAQMRQALENCGLRWKSAALDCVTYSRQPPMCPAAVGTISLSRGTKSPPASVTTTHPAHWLV